MQAKLTMNHAKDLYAFWADTIAHEATTGTDCILNLASKEYSQCISKHLPAGMRFITCVFGEKKNGRIAEKGTLCKMARGEMVRYLAENQIEDPEEAKGFTGLNFRYSPDDSDESHYVFIVQPKA